MRVRAAGDETVLELLVKTIETNRLFLDAIESGDEDPVFEIEVSNAGTKPLVLRQVDNFGFPAVTQVATQVIMETTRPIFRRPAGAFKVSVISTSQAERVSFLETAVKVQPEHAF